MANSVYKGSDPSLTADLKRVNWPPLQYEYVKHGHLSHTSYIEAAALVCDKELDLEAQKFKAVYLNWEKKAEQFFKPEVSKQAYLYTHVLPIMTAKTPTMGPYSRTPVVFDDVFLILTKEDFDEAWRSGLAFRLCCEHQECNRLFDFWMQHSQQDTYELLAGRMSGDREFDLSLIIPFNVVERNILFYSATCLLVLLARHYHKTVQDVGLDDVVKTADFKRGYNGSVWEQLYPNAIWPTWQQQLSVLFNPDHSVHKQGYTKDKVSCFNYLPACQPPSAEHSLLGYIQANRMPAALHYIDGVGFSAKLSSANHFPVFAHFDIKCDDYQHFVLRDDPHIGGVWAAQMGCYRSYISDHNLFIVPMAGPTRSFYTKELWQADVAWQAYQCIEHMRIHMLRSAFGSIAAPKVQLRDWDMAPKWEDLRCDVRGWTAHWPLLRSVYDN